MSIIDPEIILVSFGDLSDDFEELIYLCQCGLDTLSNLRKQIIGVKRHFRPAIYSQIEKETAGLTEKFRQYQKELNHHFQTLKTGKQTVDNLISLKNTKNTYFELIRISQNLLGNTATAADWQSPSYLHTQYSQAGKQTGKIIGTINDYKRDAHLDELDFEKKFLQEYVDCPLKFRCSAYLTNSGMAAFTTIFVYLLSEGKIKNKVMVGKNSYFQYKQILVNSLKDKIIEVEEDDTDKIIKIIKAEKPTVIFFDSLCNAYSLPLPDLDRIIEILRKTVREETYLVIDNTCLASFYQPLRKICWGGKLHLIVFESLNKHYQFGMDKVTAGIIIARQPEALKIFEYRKHAGTNITDISVYALPKPNRKLLTKRLNKHYRNAFYLADKIQTHLNQKPSKLIEKIIYPGLPNHPSYKWNKHLPFKGSFFNLQFRRGNSVAVYKKFIASIMKKAEKQKVNLIAGTSFGLNTTRVYLTSLWTDFGRPFVRISVGTENLWEMEKILRVFLSAI